MLRPILGKPLLSRLLECVRRARYTGTVAVITTSEVEDDSIELLCLAEEVICVRGHPTDPLDRHFEAATLLDADIVVKIPSDCPLKVLLRLLASAESATMLHVLWWPVQRDT